MKLESVLCSAIYLIERVDSFLSFFFLIFALSIRVSAQEDTASPGTQERKDFYRDIHLIFFLHELFQNFQIINTVV